MSCGPSAKLSYWLLKMSADCVDALFVVISVRR